MYFVKNYERLNKFWNALVQNSQKKKILAKPVWFFIPKKIELNNRLLSIVYKLTEYSRDQVEVQTPKIERFSISS